VEVKIIQGIRGEDCERSQERNGKILSVGHLLKVKAVYGSDPCTTLPSTVRGLIWRR
jgi:hypothetical protein